MRLTESQINDVIASYVEEIKREDEIFRRHAKIHPEHVHFQRDSQVVGEGMYTLHNQNMWPEITGAGLWEISPTYWLR
jgi:uncharacterized protein YpmS